MTFQAEASVGPGVYWNDAWAFYVGNINDDPVFNDRIYTWPTAPVYVMDVFEITATYDGATLKSGSPLNCTSSPSGTLAGDGTCQLTGDWPPGWQQRGKINRRAGDPARLFIPRGVTPPEVT